MLSNETNIQRTGKDTDLVNILSCIYRIFKSSRELNYI